MPLSLDFSNDLKITGLLSCRINKKSVTSVESKKDDVVDESKEIEDPAEKATVLFSMMEEISAHEREEQQTELRNSIEENDEIEENKKASVLEQPVEEKESPLLNVKNANQNMEKAGFSIQDIALVVLSFLILVCLVGLVTLNTRVAKLESSIEVKSDRAVEDRP